MTSLEAAAAALAQHATRLAADEHRQAHPRTSSGRERAILRLLGVTGLDAAGHPLAGQVVDGYVGGSADRLARGVALPFAMAALEYNAEPQELALAIAAGTVDLAAEARLLESADRRAAALALLARLVDAAMARIDANRTASHELLDLLGDAPRPWVATSLGEPGAIEAIEEAGALIRAGADLLRVAIPPGRELLAGLGEVGRDASPWRPRAGTRTAAAAGEDAAPAGSQRGIAALRAALDRAGAERSACVRLAIAPPALGAPEAAVVAAFERADLVELDPMAEIVGVGIDPGRAIADHRFAARILARAGVGVVLTAGALAVGPEMLSGRPAGAEIRAGRALALQLLAVELLRAAGLGPDRVVVAAVPAWHMDEAEAVARAAGEVALRRTLLPGHALAFIEPDGPLSGVPGGRATWPHLVAALMGGDQGVQIVSRRANGLASTDEPFIAAAAAVRGAAHVAAALAPTAPTAPTRHAPTNLATLTGPAHAHAAAVLAAAGETLDELGRAGWGSLVGGAGELARGFGRDAVAVRSGDEEIVEAALSASSAG